MGNEVNITMSTSMIESTAGADGGSGVGSLATPRPFAGPVVVGTAAERARQVLEAFPDKTRLVEQQATTIAGTFDPDVRNWASGCLDILERTFPEVAEYLEATAVAVGGDFIDLYVASHAAVLRDGFRIPGVEPMDGCSTAAGRHREVGAWIVKNRDSAPSSRERQVVVEHRDPDWHGRSVATVSAVGGSMAISSGMNSSGFAVVDTAVRVKEAPPGIFRGHLQDGLLGRCTSVEEAVDLIQTVPHLGGTMTLADASGAIAAVDLSPTGPKVQWGSGGDGVARTNHFPPADAEVELVTDPADRTHSECRLDSMDAIVTATNGTESGWPETHEWLRSEMGTHDGPGAQCVHGRKSVTISTTIYSTRPASMTTSDGPGCEGCWVRWTAPTSETPGAESRPVGAA